MGHGHGWSISVAMIMSSSFVFRPMGCHVGTGLSSFVLAELIIANENVGLPCFGGPWTAYQCHSVERPVTTISVRSRPRPMRLS